MLEPAPLEDWLRERYFRASADISSSGVEPYTWGDIESLLELDPRELSDLSFRDNPSAGSEELRSLVAQRYGVADPSRIIVASGSTEAQLLVLAGTLHVGDEVVVIEPAYHSLISTVRALGCRVTRWRLRPEDGFRPDLDELRRLVTSRTRMILVNFPHNPTGVTLTPDEQRELVGIAAQYGCHLFWDGAFEDLVFDAPPLPPASVLDERALSFGTMSKSFGLPGLRVGWGIVPPDVVRAAVSVRDYTSLASSSLVEFVATRALRGAHRLVGPRLRTAANNRGMLHEWLDLHQRFISCPRDGAGVVVFPALTRVSETRRFCDRLMREHQVLLVPGECFQMPGHIRLGFGGDPVALRKGLESLSALLASWDEQ